MQAIAIRHFSVESGSAKTVSSHRGEQRRAFTLAELLVVLAILIVLIALLLPSINAARSAAVRIMCASNLRSIGQSMLYYATENEGALPRAYWIQNFAYDSNVDHTWHGLRGFTDPLATNPFANPSVWNADNVTPPWKANLRPGDNDVTAAIFLLLRNYNMPSKAFICPASGHFIPDDFGGSTASQRSNFTSPTNLGYSISLPYTYNGSANGYRWDIKSFSSNFAFMADLNPGESLTQARPNCVVTYSYLYGNPGPQTPDDPMARQQLANSSNHYKMGQNVLYIDGRVEWAKTAFCGYQQDNIYTSAGNPALAAGIDNRWTCIDQITRTPRHANDSQMQPSENAMTIGYGIGIW